MGSPAAILSVILQCCTLVTVIFSAIKVINRNTDEWRQRELRLAEIERRITKFDLELSHVQDMEKQVSTITAQMADLLSEFKRIRDRLDRFLDMSSSGGGGAPSTRQ